MPLAIGLLFGIIGGLAVPFAVREHPDTFRGMLSGGMLWIPYFDASVHWSWPVFLMITVLIWGLLKVARG